MSVAMSPGGCQRLIMCHRPIARPYICRMDVESPPDHGSIHGLFRSAPIDRDRTQFVLELLRELASVLEETVGLDEAQGFIAVVGGRIGITMNEEYRAATGAGQLDVTEVAGALVDLKRRIDGGFSIERMDGDAIVLVNDACPFGAYVAGRESLCMMTSNVFGRITADNLGYARVDIEESIARADGRCRVVVHLVEGRGGREYYG